MAVQWDQSHDQSVHRLETFVWAHLNLRGGGGARVLGLEMIKSTWYPHAEISCIHYRCRECQ